MQIYQDNDLKDGVAFYKDINGKTIYVGIMATWEWYCSNQRDCSSFHVFPAHFVKSQQVIEMKTHQQIDSIQNEGQLSFL